MQPVTNCNQPKPASNLNVVLDDGTIHSFDLNTVVEVHISQTCIVAHLYDRDEAAPGPREHTPTTIAEEWHCPHCGGPDPPHLDLHRKCADYAEEANIVPPLPASQTTLDDVFVDLDQRRRELLEREAASFGRSEAQESTQTCREVVRRPNHPGRGSGGTPSHCSRCRSPHRRAHISRVAANGHVTKRCFDCARTGNATAENLRQVRWALFNTIPRFLYEVETMISDNGSSRKLLALRGLAEANGVPIQAVEQ